MAAAAAASRELIPPPSFICEMSIYDVITILFRCYYNVFKEYEFRVGIGLSLDERGGGLFERGANSTSASTNVVRVNYTHHYSPALSRGELISHR